MNTASDTQNMAFEAEVNQLLQLMIHSLYSNQEIFLRELISNASDACDKLRFESLEDDKLQQDASDLAVTISFDEENKTITGQRQRYWNDSGRGYHQHRHDCEIGNPAIS